MEGWLEVIRWGEREKGHESFDLTYSTLLVVVKTSVLLCVGERTRTSACVCACACAFVCVFLGVRGKGLLMEEGGCVMDLKLPTETWTPTQDPGGFFFFLVGQGGGAELGLATS